MARRESSKEEKYEILIAYEKGELTLRNFSKYIRRAGISLAAYYKWSNEHLLP
ncbi:hypothetical protein [Bacillus pinisoli]|uniref:hypothetical protein n=1 Tax=Bacillus pinisoli TaxID=2901866 RepID=UPI001FF44853|nr:hypothetical protein [Bacillus pinisoli]